MTLTVAIAVLGAVLFFGGCLTLVWALCRIAADSVGDASQFFTPDEQKRPDGHPDAS
jgi:hypothetical protein